MRYFILGFLISTIIWMLVLCHPNAVKKHYNELLERGILKYKDYDTDNWLGLNAHVTRVQIKDNQVKLYEGDTLISCLNLFLEDSK